MLLGLAQRRGQALTLSVLSVGTYNPDTGAVSGQTTTSMSVLALVSNAGTKVVDSVAVQPGDAVLMVPVQAALTTPPVGGQTKATIDGVVRHALAVETRRYQGSIGGYVLLLRGAV